MKIQNNQLVSEMTHIHAFIEDFKDNICFRLDENVRMVQISLNALSEEELWKKPNSKLNSVGNLLLHLCGNIAQYVLSGIGGEEDHRNRPFEFEAADGFTKDELKNRLLLTIGKAKQIIQETPAERLLEQKNIQGFHLSGIGAVIHAVEHFSYHTGQIAFWVKLLRESDLEFYSGMNLNTLNE